jgi:phospholipid N-methyltransferase
MPGSSNVLFDLIVTVLRVLEPRTVCDIGAGMGKYGHILREMSGEAGFATKLTAVEIDRSYVEQYALDKIYDEVIVADAVELIRDPSRRFDVVVIGDCIEHLRKSDGVDLLNFLVYRAGYIVVVYPVEYIQDGPSDHAQEAHISVWSEADFVNFKCLHAVRTIGSTTIKLALIKGYQPVANTILAINDQNLVVNYHGTTGEIPLAQIL